MKKIYTLICSVLIPGLCFSQENSPQLDTGDTAWVLMATALVMLMTPAGLALFYGGLTKSKNMLNTIGMSYIAFCIAFLVWVVVGYSIAFSGNGRFMGDFDNVMLKNINITDLQGSIPALLFVAFQGTFAAIAVAIVSGSIIERVKFTTWTLFAMLWTLLIYCPIAHWVWGGGFLSENGELDFAGGTVIHINAGIAGLVVSYMLGKRKDYASYPTRPSSVKLTVLGSALLWFGWFGFNAGSQLAADFIAANAFLVTCVSACAGGVSWMVIEFIDVKKPTLIGSASGVISGLVAITPAAGYVDVSGALCIGLLGGLVGYLGTVKLKKMIGYDDTLDAFGVHGLVGILGALMTGILANPAINEGTGLLYGNPAQFLIQLKVVGITIAYSAIGTFAVFKLCSLITNGARVTEIVEYNGLDSMIHGERGFDLNEEVLEPAFKNN
ncbi:MAG: ammonium transporter [Flavobacteriales bacterium]|nr:ammonium transporter [Flavobacteriales bacterium]